MKYKDFAPTSFDSGGAFLPDDRQNWLVVPCSQNRDSGSLDKSNFETALKILGGEGDLVEVHRFGHWGPGWFEIIVAHPNKEAEVKDIERRLESYPVLDEDDMSSKERDEFVESWDSWGRKDYMRAVAKRIESETDEVECIPSSEVADTVQELDYSAIDEAAEVAAETVDWHYQCDGSGVTINISGLAECTDIDKIAKLAADLIWEERRTKDIKKFAHLMGLGYAADQAVRDDADTATKIRESARKLDAISKKT